MNFIKQTLLILLLSQSSYASAESFTVAAAADLKYAMADVSAEFTKLYPDSKPDIVFGSSGKIYQQIANGAPYDIFFSADINFPRLLNDAGKTASIVRPYAIGRIVLWTKADLSGKLDMERLTANDIRHVAIANPKHAPYGMRAQEALEALGLWNKISPKLVFGENIAQAAQFVDSGAAEAGIIALSLMLNPQIKNKGRYVIIPDNLHKPLEQGYVVLKRAENNPEAKAFAAFVASEKGRAIFRAWGFVRPEESL